MNKRGIGKKGQELSIGTLILIVLGVIVLVLLVLGFTIGWKNLFGKIGITTTSDLSTMVSACKLHASVGDKVSYCEFREVKIGGKTLEINCEFNSVKSGLEGQEISGGCGDDVKKLYKKNIDGEKAPVCKNTDGSGANSESCLCGTAICNVGKKCTTSNNKCE